LEVKGSYIGGSCMFCGSYIGGITSTTGCYIRGQIFMPWKQS